ncbi:MAG: PAS domain S-box protein [Ruminococcaceae bacterium]|nr:PAS domain S-box protein [Oscillospiraceae bacterium]
MTKKIFRRMLFITLLAVVVCSFFIIMIFSNYLASNTMGQLRERARHVASSLENVENVESYLSSLGSGKMRITLIEADGTVLYDSEANAAEMENHSDRPEVVEALQNNTGEATRLSKTLVQRTQYAAIKIKNGGVLRVSEEQLSVGGLILLLIQPILLVFFVMAIFIYLMSSYASKGVFSYINNINLDDPLNNKNYEELSPLLTKIHKQNLEINKRISEYKNYRNEFKVLSKNMNEGLILIDLSGQVISVNKKAERIFGVMESHVIGKSILSITRDLNISEVVNKALSGTKEEITFSLNGRTYSLMATPISKNTSPTGCTVLILDITEKAKSEKMRREFSANVSHELKTPLQAISGYSELLMNGLVSDDDIVDFAKKINSESLRMSDLINDIIKLSRLDEQYDVFKKESFDINQLCNELFERYKPIIENRGFDFTVNFPKGALYIDGVPFLIEEMISNLIDNAINYNKPDGSIDFSLIENKKSKKVEIIVSDTGIGIPEDELPRIFERFYRVEKSKSRDFGGTGIGLAIVKHTAQLHNASIEINSELSVGTTVKVIFASTN